MAAKPFTEKQIAKEVAKEKESLLPEKPEKDKEIIKDKHEKEKTEKEKHEKNETKEHKDKQEKEKNEKEKHEKEQKEAKEHKEQKEHKDKLEKHEKQEKPEKEKHEKELKDHKEAAKEKEAVKEKETIKPEKEGKLEQKELEKIQPDGKELVETQIPQQPGDPTNEQRLAAVESALAQLTHFIPENLRPDLSKGALKQEPQAGTGTEPAAPAKEPEKGKK